MISSARVRRISLFFLAIFLVGISFYFAKSSNHNPSRTQQSADVSESKQTHREWPRWGGALNSAQRSGDGFFNHAQARQFAQSFDKNFQRFVVDLNARAFLPEPGRANLDDALGTEKTYGTVYLQFFEHPTVNERQHLLGLGVELFSYCGGYAWSARGTRDAFDASVKLPNVRALAAIDPRDKLSEAVYRAFPYRSLDEGFGKPQGAVPQYAISESGSRFSVIAIPGTTYDDIVEALKQQEALPPSLQLYERPRSVLGPRFEIIASLGLAPEIAALRSTAFVEFVAPPAASRGTGVASRDAKTDDESNIDDVRDGPLGLSGSSVSVVVREIGKPAAHVDFQSRLTPIDTNGDTTPTPADHATAVAGQIGSSGQNQPAAKGVAPGVSMLVYAVNPDTFETGDVIDAAKRGARISNHSYGPTGPNGTALPPSDFGSYQTTSADWDTAIRNSDLIGMFSGNEESGGLSKHIDFFVGAKNTICVGASSSLAHAFDDSPSQPATDGIAPYSEFGPMNDGRVKPDLVAFGGNANNPNLPSPGGVTLDQGTNSTQVQSGSSFAAPTVTGITALMFQHFKTVVGREPSGALAKALLCNSATDLGAKGPDQTYGFGIANAEAAINTINLRVSDTATPFFEGTLNNGEIATFLVDVQTNSQLKATLCWLDPAGNPASAKALINDLDLELVSPSGTTTYPFSLDPNNPSSPATNTGPNTVDPIEQIIVDSPATGTWTLRVKGTSIPQGPQSFAVCLNQTSKPPPLTFSIVASPDSGPAKLTVDFTAVSGVPGVTATYTWLFSDDNTTQTGQNVTHTFNDVGTFLVTLTVTAAGSTFTDTKIITVGRRDVTAFAEKGRIRLNFSGKRSDLDLTMIADDPVRDANDPATSKGFIFPRTRQQAREAIRDGEFEGQTYTARIANIDQNGVQQGQYLVSNVILDRKASFKSTTADVRLNLLRGEVRIRVRDPNLPSSLGITPQTTGPLNFSVYFEASLITYHTVFTLQYSNKGSSGFGKTP